MIYHCLQIAYKTTSNYTFQSAVRFYSLLKVWISSLFSAVSLIARIQYISKNVRRLYGLPPDTVDGHRRRSVHDVYGRYYAHLATGAAAGTLFDYVLSVGAVSRPRRKPSGCPLGRRSPPPRPDATLLAGPRAGRCGLADAAVARLRTERTGTACRESRAAGPDDGARSIPNRSVFRDESRR